jgi:hypothetical protein
MVITGYGRTQEASSRLQSQVRGRPFQILNGGLPFPVDIAARIFNQTLRFLPRLFRHGSPEAVGLFTALIENASGFPVRIRHDLPVLLQQSLRLLTCSLGLFE